MRKGTLWNKPVSKGIISQSQEQPLHIIKLHDSQSSQVSFWVGTLDKCRGHYRDECWVRRQGVRRQELRGTIFVSEWAPWLTLTQSVHSLRSTWGLCVLLHCRCQRSHMVSVSLCLRKEEERTKAVSWRLYCVDSSLSSDLKRTPLLCVPWSQGEDPWIMQAELGLDYWILCCRGNTGVLSK